MLTRRVTLSVEAAATLLQIIGIMDDNGVGALPGRTLTLEALLRSTWPGEELERLEGEDRTVDLELEDAALLLEGLAYTEAMSTELPWFDMVQWTVDFVTEHLRSPWTDEEWRTYSSR